MELTLTLDILYIHIGIFRYRHQPVVSTFCDHQTAMYTPCSTEISRPLTVYLHGSAEACLILMARKAHLKHTADGSEIPYNHLGCIEHYKTLEIMADNLPTSTGAGFLNHQQYFLISLLVMLPLTLP